MDEKRPNIRFTRRELKKINRLAELNDSGAEQILYRRRRSPFSRVFQFFISIVMAFAILVGVGFVALRGGIDSEMLRSEAEKSLIDILGTDATASIQKASLSFDDGNHIALAAGGVSIVDTKQGLAINDIKSVKLGLATFPLISGRLRIAQLEIDGASFTLPKSDQDSDFWQTIPVDSDGYIDSDKISDELFSMMRRSLELLDVHTTETLAIQNSTLNFATGDETQSIQIDNLRLTDNGNNVELHGTVVWKGDVVAIDGRIDRSAANKELLGFQLNVVNVPIKMGSSEEVSPVIDGNKINPALFDLQGRAQLEITGVETTSDTPAKLTAKLSVDDIDMQLGRVDDVRGFAQLELDHVVGSHKLEIRSSSFALGGLQAKFNGAIGRDPQANASEPSYKFEIVTDTATSMPAESSERPLSFASQIAGRFLARQKRIEFSDLGIKTGPGELYGQGSMGFGNGSPEMIFFLRIPKMPVADAKHLWPIDVADGARAWVLKNLFGGEIRDSKIEISLAGGRFNGPGLPPPLTGDEIKVDFNVFDTRFDVIGELPAVRDADGVITVRGAHATIKLPRGTAYTADNRAANVSDGTLVIPWGPQRPVIADLDLVVSGEAAAIAEIAGRKPIDVLKNVPFRAEDVKGDVSAKVKVAFAVSKDPPPGTLKWSADIGLKNLDIAKPIGGSVVSNANGNIKVDQKQALITAEAKLDGIPANISMTEPVDLSLGLQRSQTIKLVLDDKMRDTIVPGLRSILNGKILAEIGMVENGKRRVALDLANTEINLTALGWKKGAKIPAKATFDLIQNPNDKDTLEVRDLAFVGDTFGAKGNLSVVNGDLRSANLNQLHFTRNDSLTVKAERASGGFRINVSGKKFDARSLIKQISDSEKSDGAGDGDSAKVIVNAHVESVDGFNGESLQNVAISYESAGKKISGASVNATTSNGRSFVATNNQQGGARSISLQSNDAGAVLRFFDFYDKMQGGEISVGLAAQGNNPLVGQIDARNFSIVNEPKLSSLVSSRPANGGDSLSQAVKRDIDVSRVNIERGYSLIEKGNGYLNLSKGVVRGPTIGTTFQGTLYDKQGNMAITGTFMPAYGVNRIFGEVPVLGAILGNGRDRGLIGITYKLVGSTKQPQVIVNPISAIAPGIFRSIFEF